MDALIAKLCLSPVDAGGFNLDPPDDPVIEGLGAQAAEWKRKLIELMLLCLINQCRHLRGGLQIFAAESEIPAESKEM